MDTPRSESPSFMASPAVELDDHRFQPQSLPRRPEVLGLRSIPRDNEHAVYDSSDLLAPPFVGIDHAPDDVLCWGRPASITPGIREDVPSIRLPSRPSTRQASRSPSPPNSVDAFADPGHRRLRDRSGTMTSQYPSEIGLTLQRTNSRRPTFNGNDELSGDSQNAACQDAEEAEEDVCFPPPDESRIRGALIDFEEMDEFVALQNRERLTMRQRNTSTTGSVQGESNLHTGACNSDKYSVIEDPEKQDHLTPHRSPDRQAPRRFSNPDRFSFFSSEMDASIHAPEIGDLLMDGESFSQLFRAGQGVWWLGCLNPSTEEFAMLMKAFAIHPLTAEDIRVQETREKVELFAKYYFVCFRSFVQQKTSDDMEPINIYLIVFREGVLTFQFTASNHSANVRKRIRQLRDYVGISSDWICYALIDDIVDSFAPVITDIERDTDAIEDAVFTARLEDYSALLKRIGDCRKKTMSVLRLLGGKADVIKGFAKRCNEEYSVTPRGDIGLYLGDIQGDNFFILWHN
jgi:magnesium transporter